MKNVKKVKTYMRTKKSFFYEQNESEHNENSDRCETRENVTK